jgi:hypothetical protein
VLMEVDNAELVRRISGRRTCADCGRVFNLFTAPSAQAQSEPCPKTGAPHRLTQRPDDNEATVADRLKVYDEKTRPLIDFYAKRGLLRTIRAAGDVDEITRRLEAALEGVLAPPVQRAKPANRAKSAKRSRKAKTAKKSIANSGGIGRNPGGIGGIAEQSAGSEASPIPEGSAGDRREAERRPPERRQTTLSSCRGHSHQGRLAIAASRRQSSALP